MLVACAVAFFIGAIVGAVAMALCFIAKDEIDIVERQGEK